jgi:hypothetical protein
MFLARVHHTTVEDIPEGEPVTTGMFSVNQHPTVVLFDSGSSHSFMSSTFAQRYNQQSEELGYRYRISSAGADVLTNQIARGVSLEIEGRRFWVNFIIMPELALDIILGMHWMKNWGVALDTRKRILSLKEPKGEGMFQVPLSGRIGLTSVSCTMQVTSLADISVVCEFLDVFPKDLSGLSPKRVVEFAIELVPGTAPISKRPYRMSPNELAELKV